MPAYWTQEDEVTLDAIDSFEGLADMAVDVVSRLSKEGKEVVQICGPMSTGGLGDLAANMARFRLSIDRALENGLLVFDQIPFQRVLIRLCSLRPSGGDYDWDILEVFYRRIFESGHVHRALFLEGWDGSVGARWERELVTRLGLKVEEYPMEWLG